MPVICKPGRHHLLLTSSQPWLMARALSLILLSTPLAGLVASLNSREQFQEMLIFFNFARLGEVDKISKSSKMGWRHLTMCIANLELKLATMFSPLSLLAPKWTDFFFKSKTKLPRSNNHIKIANVDQILYSLRSGWTCTFPTSRDVFPANLDCLFLFENDLFAFLNRQDRNQS